MDTSISINKKFVWQGQPSEKSAKVMRMFGLDIDRLRNRKRSIQADVKIKPGDIVYLTGASGSGKSVLLREIFQHYKTKSDAEVVNVDDVDLSSDKTVVDCVKGDLIDSLRFLSKAGLSDVYNVLNYPDKLSEGQKYRFKLACAIASDADIIFADEFCSNLDRLTAVGVAKKIASFARDKGKTLVLASSHDDLMADIQPDVVVVKYLSAETHVIYKTDPRR